MESRMPVGTVLTIGVFDLFHVGHLRLLQRAASLGDRLMVGVHPDEVVRQYKRQPIIPFDQRVEIVRALPMVSHVFAAQLECDEEFYRTHRIALHCQGDDQFGYCQVARRLGIFRELGRTPDVDTTHIIDRIVSDQALAE
jgi:cytidyltransferase-like protein